MQVSYIGDEWKVAELETTPMIESLAGRELEWTSGMSEIPIDDIRGCA